MYVYTPEKYLFCFKLVVYIILSILTEIIYGFETMMVFQTSCLLAGIILAYIYYFHQINDWCIFIWNELKILAQMPDEDKIYFHIPNE